MTWILSLVNTLERWLCSQYHRWLISSRHRVIERFLFDLEMKTREQNKQQSNGNRAIRLVYRTDTNARGFWLVKRTHRWKNFMPVNFLRMNRYFALTSYCNTIGQSMPSPYQGFLWRKIEESVFWSFHPLADKTNNEHLRKPFFKVIRKSLYPYPLYTLLLLYFRDRMFHIR